tara:strand:+ start:4128 stop:5468 length:1341 start_codon:yes stop_codon:yes gene_type:complete
MKKSNFIDLISSIDDWLWEVDEKGTYTYSSPQIFDILGYLPEEVIGKTPFDLMAPEEIERIKCEFSKFAEEQKPFAFLQNVNLHKNGSRVTLETSGRPYYNDDGVFSGYRGIDRNISERILEKNILRLVDKKLPGALIQYILHPDQTSELTYMSSTASGVWGYSAEDVERDPGILVNHVHPDDQQRVHASIQESANNLEDWDCKYRMYNKHGKMMWLRGIGTPQRLKNGSTQWHSIITEITDKVLAAENRINGFKQTIKALSNAVMARDPYTAAHEDKVAKVARLIGVKMGMEDSTLEGLELAAIIHDLGKISIPSEILSKPGKLSKEEFDLVKTHATRGSDLIRNINFDWPIAKIMEQHHERLDGSGYPYGLKGDNILLEARIIGVADTLEAMSSHRPYRPGLGIEIAAEEIRQNAGIKYDKEVATACLALVENGEIQKILDAAD